MGYGVVVNGINPIPASLQPFDIAFTQHTHHWGKVTLVEVHVKVLRLTDGDHFEQMSTAKSGSSPRI
jgi:hypothetical protein